MLKSLRNIEGAFALSRFYLIAITAAAVSISCYSIYWAFDFAQKQRERIYVLDNGKSLMLALSQDIQMNRPAEAKYHVKLFHEKFFTLIPDGEANEANIQDALYLADESALNFYKNRKEKGYYTKLVGAGIINEIKIDSIAIDMDNYPYRATTYATTSTMRSSSVSYYQLTTECQLVNCPRSEHNPHGLMIEKWDVKGMSEIITKQR